MSRRVITPAPGEVPPASEVGGKAHNLARLAAVPGVRVPPWLVIAATVFEEVMGGDVLHEPAASIRERLATLEIPPALATALRTALRHRDMEGSLVAVRSSATVEDAAAASFAGQFASVLGVRVTSDLRALWDAVKAVWLSAYSDHAIAYVRGRPAAPDSDALRMAVLIQALAPARASGVAFSIDPVTGDRDIAVVSAAYGLGELLVAGEVDADTMRVRFGHDAATIVESRPAVKQQALVRQPGPAGGTIRLDVPPELADQPALSEAQVLEVAAVVRTLQLALRAPQDIEWAIGAAASDHGVCGPRADDVLYVLQARPVTATGAARTGVRRLWDNSNIVESYSGVTTPLTFSFARGVYEQVYRQFCEVLGVGPTMIEAHGETFANMLGLIRGRVYYNLLNWYRVLALLPGYAVNREFMERMMGVRERLADPPPPPGAGARSLDAARLLRSVTRLWNEHRRLDRENRAFFALVNRALEPIQGVDLDTWSADDLVALYRRLDRELLLEWRAPLVNDFFAMIWFGVLSRLVEQWLPDAEPTLVNDLLVGEGGIISTEPARRIMALAALVASDPALRERFDAQPDDDALLRAVRADPQHAAFSRALDEYLVAFGDRCIGELKLETVTPNEDPAFVIHMTRAYVARQQVDAARGADGDGAVRRAAESYARARLGAPRRSAFFMVARHARDRVRDRENLRFERTRVFGAVRRIFRGLGHRLHEAGRLASPRDVFYLTVEEVFAAVTGTGMTPDLSAVARARREAFARYEAEPAPPERFETFGLPDAPPASAAPGGDANAGAGARASTNGTDNGEGTTVAELKGLGCCPGIVRAPVRVVRDPSAAGNLHGHILVAERTDPGWTLLFPTASGLLVQRGSLLSHSAIVAREIGLPCVVAIPDLMHALVDGEWVEMDGTTGVVRRIAAPTGDGAPA